MVRMAEEHTLCPVKLLDEHDSGESMRQRQRRQRPALDRACTNRRRVTIGAADQQRKIGCLAREAFESVGEIPRAEALARFVEQDQALPILDGGEDLLAFLVACRIGAARGTARRRLNDIQLTAPRRADARSRKNYSIQKI